MPRAYVGLGANLGDREASLRSALELLAAEPGIELVASSSIRETDPVGYEEQPRFLNAAACVETELSARELLDVLLGIERRLGRTRTGPRYGPRTIDLGAGSGPGRARRRPSVGLAGRARMKADVPLGRA